MDNRSRFSSALVLLLVAAAACLSCAGEDNLPPSATATATLIDSTSTSEANSQESQAPTDETPGATPSSIRSQDADKHARLEEFANVYLNARAERDWLLLYASLPDEFKEKCSGEAYAAMMALFIEPFYQEGATHVLEGVRVDGDRGWIDYHIVYRTGGAEYPFSDGLTWVDNEWVFSVSPEELAKDKPCSVEGILESGGESTP